MSEVEGLVFAKSEAEFQDYETWFKSPGRDRTLLVDPTWQAPLPRSGRFVPNPHFVPSTPDSPSDPIDAVIRLVARGEAETARLYSVLKESVFAVATEPLHRAAVPAGKWREVAASELAGLLIEHDVDLLLNPGGRYCVRLVRTVVAGRLTEMGDDSS